jgi:hypothetical protein
MLKKSFFVSVIMLVLTVVVFAQGTIDKNGVNYPTEEELARRKRVAEILQHPTFITLRLLSSPRDLPREESTDAPAPYRVKDWIGFRLLVSQNLFEEIPVAKFKWPYAEIRPVLMRGRDIIPYSKQAEAAVERAEELFGPAFELKLKAGAEYELQDIHLDDWYDPLPPGRYELTVRRRFDWQGDWLTSTPVYFEVQARTATPIPDGVKIEMVPEGLRPKKDGTYELGRDVFIRLFVVNNSDQRVKVSVVDRYYGTRPQLFNGGVLIPYRQEAESLIKSKEENPRFVELANDFFLDPGTRSGLLYVKLNDWYGPLRPGSYRIINRQRFEIDGPWTAASGPMLFQVASAQPK